jgi:hypothetical protein
MVQVERGLTLFKSGDDALRADREAVRAGSRYTRGLGFVDNPWGEKVCRLGRTTSRLDDTHWGMIKEHASAHLGAPGEETDERISGFDEVNMHAYIDLDW